MRYDSMPSRRQTASAPAGANMKSGLTILSCALPSADRITRSRNSVPGIARLSCSIVEIIIGRSRPKSAVSGTPIVTTGCIPPSAGTAQDSPFPIVTGVVVDKDADDKTSTLSRSSAGVCAVTAEESAVVGASAEKAGAKTMHPAATHVKASRPDEPISSVLRLLAAFVR